MILFSIQFENTECSCSSYNIPRSPVPILDAPVLLLDLELSGSIQLLPRVPLEIEVLSQQAFFVFLVFNLWFRI